MRYVKKVVDWDMATPRERLTRWQNVQRVLENLTPHQRRKHFAMGTWLEQTDCGTVGCIAGHASLDPWFQRRGIVGSIARNLVRSTLTSSDHLIEFFGSYGYSAIFVGAGINTYGDGIKAVRKYVKELEKDASKKAA